MNEFKTVNSILDLDELVAEFKSRGFTQHPQPLERFYNLNILFSKRLRDVEPVCITNDKLCLHVSVTEYLRDGFHHQGFQADIAGQSPNGEWVKAECYGYRFGEMFDQLPTIERRLVAGWKALCTE